MKTLLFTIGIICLCYGSLLAQEPCIPTDRNLSSDTLKESKHDFARLFKTDGAANAFARDSIDKLRSFDTNTYVRIYFALEKDSFPNFLPYVIMVPYSQDDCDLDFTSNVLVSNLGADSSIIMSGRDSKIQEDLQNWKNIYENSPLDTFAVRYGFCFTWDTIFAACRTPTNDLRVNYSILTDPDDSVAIHMVLSDVWSQDPQEGNRPKLDYSRPCPKFCGSLLDEGKLD